ncbi:hypothetical protein F4826_003346 [Rahnella inusitata]|nr:hypothetical protein [Rahnella inusitata]
MINVEFFPVDNFFRDQIIISVERFSVDILLWQVFVRSF